MKVKGMFVIQLKTGYTETDMINETDLVINGTYYGGRNKELNIPVPKIGDELTIFIPSGNLSGKVVEVIPQYNESGWVTDVVYLSGQWDGFANGLRGGLFAFGRFKIISTGAMVVETSIVSQPITYKQYQALKKDAEYLLEDPDIPYSPEINQAAMRFAARYMENDWAGAHMDEFRDYINHYINNNTERS